MQMRLIFSIIFIYDVIFRCVDFLPQYLSHCILLFRVNGQFDDILDYMSEKTTRIFIYADEGTIEVYLFIICIEIIY